MSTFDQPGLGLLLRRAYFQMRRRLEEETKSLELTAEQYAVVYALEEAEGLTQRELGDRLFTDPNTMTGILNRLEEGGWLTRVRDPNDRRARRVRLTRSGRRRRDQALAGGMRVKRAALEGFSREERETLFEYLGRIYENVAEVEP